MRRHRGIPALLLLAALVTFGWVYGEYTEGRWTPAAAFALPPLAALALGGLVDPRILWSVGPHRRSMPRGIRIIGALLFAAGLALSLALMTWVHLHGWDQK